MTKVLVLYYSSYGHLEQMAYSVAEGARQAGAEAILGSIPFFLHHGMIVVGLPYSAQGQMRIDEVSGGSPYGATTISGPDNSRKPSANELELARFQGQHVAEVAIRQRVPLQVAKSAG